MKKLISLLLVAVMILSLAACSKPADTNNEKPVISGVKDAVVEAGSEFNALAGVTATDKEDGDLTSKITIESSPALSFKDGKATPEKAGSYELTYSVTDKAGETVEEYCTLTVTKKTGEAVVFQKYDFETTPEANAHGWVGYIGDSANGTATLKQGAFVFDIVSAGNGDGDVQLKLPGMPVKNADYIVKIWAKSTKDTYCHIIARNEQADGWGTFGDTWNVRITNEIKPLTLNFSCHGEGSTELLLNLGKITPNPGNPADTTPENFSVVIDKIEIYEITGEEHNAPVKTDIQGLAADAGDGAVATATGNTLTISSYPTNGGVWSIKATLPLGTEIEEGVKYYYSFNVNAEKAQGGEALVESLALFHEARANFYGLSLNPGDNKVTVVFVAEKNVSDPVIRMQIGNPSDGVSSNKLVFSNVEFGKVEGDKETIKTTHTFSSVGNGSGNEDKCPITTFNGTDEENERGVGAIWQENGSFFYRIDNGGTVDWHNKLILGYDKVPLTLPADSYFIVEIVAKADKEVGCGVFLNPCGKWDPRFSENMLIDTTEKTFTFETKETLITDMNFELLFQFGSEATAALGEVTIEISSITIYQKEVK